MAPTNVKTVHQTFLLHIESNPDRLGLLSPTHGQRSQQQSGQNTLKSVLVNKPKFVKVTLCINKENCNTEAHGGGGVELVKPERQPASGGPNPCASVKNASGIYPVRRSLLLVIVRGKQIVVKDHLSPPKSSDPRL